MVMVKTQVFIMKKILPASLMMVAVFILTGCARQSGWVVDESAPGFLMGLWHGWIAPFALVAHLFDSSVAIYSVPNNGGWYDFGFLLGIGAFGGSAGAASR